MDAHIGAQIRDLVVVAAIIIGFGILVFVYRVEREVAVQDKFDSQLLEELRRQGERRLPRQEELIPSHFPDADQLIIASIVLAILLVIVPLLSIPPAYVHFWVRFATPGDLAAIILQLFFIPAVMAHYGIGLAQGRPQSSVWAATPQKRRSSRLVSSLL